MVAEVVSTSFGRLRGEREDDLVSFLGVRYAAPPVGERRLRPPIAPDLESGISDARTFGPLAPQSAFGLGSYLPGDHVEQDEDCLFLNLWTPACDRARRPVLVFIHGGGFLSGGGSSVLYHGNHLARMGVVVVTINYRLGALGFLAHPALSDGVGIGNWGVHDQIAALRWVRDNVEVFGGDPSRVTVFGESAGAMSVGDLLGVASARGLFQRAILESGSSAVVSKDAAVRVGVQFARELGIGELTRTALTRLPLGDLLAAQQNIVAKVDAGVGMPFRPVVDGGIFVGLPATAVAAGHAASVELVLGSNRDEFRFFTATSTGLSSVDASGLERLIARYLDGGGISDRLEPSAVVAAYRAARARRGEPVDERSLLDAFGTDWIFRVPGIRLLEAQARWNPRCYCYLFDWESPFANGALGSCHALELPFVFGTLDNPIVGLFSGTGEAASELSRAMRMSWVGFAHNGDPSHDAIGTWPRYEPIRRATMVFGRTIALDDAPFEEERQFWDAPLGRFGASGSVEATRSDKTAWLSDVDSHSGM